MEVDFDLYFAPFGVRVVVGVDLASGFFAQAQDEHALDVGVGVGEEGWLEGGGVDVGFVAREEGWGHFGEDVFGGGCKCFFRLIREMSRWKIGVVQTLSQEIG